MKALIDTSFVVALVNKKDEDHEKALEFSFDFNRKRTIITDAVLLEIGNSLSRRFIKRMYRSSGRLFRVGRS